MVSQKTFSPPIRLTASGATANGTNRTTLACAIHGRSLNTATKVSRKIASGTTQRNGAAAISVVMYAVTAMTRPDGMAASAIQRIRSPALVRTSSATSAWAAAGSARVATNPTTLKRMASSANPMDQAAVCVFSVRNGSMTTG